MDALTGTPIITAAERADYAARLEELRTVRDHDLVELLRDAHRFVAEDAAEEILQIRQDHAFVEKRIQTLETLLATAQVIADDAPPDTVSIGRTVEVESVPGGDVVAYQITGSSLTTAAGTLRDARTISATSPIGTALLGRSVGDLVSFSVPSGAERSLRILDVQEAA